MMRTRPFGELFELPLRNGLKKPKGVRGADTKMVNMGELFAYPRLINAPMDRVPLTELEAERSLLRGGDLLFARQSPEQREAAFKKGCKASKQRCIELRRDGVVVATGYHLDSSVTHVAIFDVAINKARAVSREGVEVVSVGLQP
jgi:hypothetical protein